MHRDWDEEEQLLRAHARSAFSMLMGIDPAASASVPGYHSRYAADEALEAYREAQADLAAFIDDRRANDPKGASA